MEIIKCKFTKCILITLILFIPIPVLSSVPIIFDEVESQNKKIRQGEEESADLVTPVKYDDNDELLFEPYKDNYFLFLSTRKDAKFQISFKYKIFTNSSEPKKIFGKKLFWQKPVWEKIYFGYTQKSVWDWLEDSAPFEDHNFNPEIFWCSDEQNCNSLDSSGPEDEWSWKIRHYIGYEHESNGQDGSNSRNWNRLYYRFISWRGPYAIAPKVWLVTSESEIGSGDYLSQYIGYFELELFARHKNEIAYGATFRYAEKGWGILTDVSFPQRIFDSDSDFNPYWYIQLFNGYAEDLLKYNEKRNELRIGLRFTL